MPPYSTRTRPPARTRKSPRIWTTVGQGHLHRCRCLRLRDNRALSWQHKFSGEWSIFWTRLAVALLVVNANSHASQHPSSPASHCSAMRWIALPNRFIIIPSLVFVCWPSNPSLRPILSFTTVRPDHLLIPIYEAIINTPFRSSSVSFSALYPGEQYMPRDISTRATRATPFTYAFKNRTR
jgi:hypothetical protein